MLCPRSGNGIPYLALRPTRNRLVNRYFYILIFILVGSKNPLPLDMGECQILKKYFKEAIKTLFKLNKAERKILKKDLKNVIKNNIQKYHTDEMVSRMEQDPLFKKYQAAGIV